MFTYFRDTCPSIFNICKVLVVNLIDHTGHASNVLIWSCQDTPLAKDYISGCGAFSLNSQSVFFLPALFVFVLVNYVGLCKYLDL